MSNEFRLHNETVDSTLAVRAQKADSFWARFLGLMGRRSLEDGGGLILEPASSIHMFFMRFPIDAVFVDKKWRILHISPTLKPWRMSRHVFRARRVIELPAGTCERTGTERGHVISIG